MLDFFAAFFMLQLFTGVLKKKAGGTGTGSSVAQEAARTGRRTSSPSQKISIKFIFKVRIKKII